MMKRIVIDCDGILCEWQRPFVALLEQQGAVMDIPASGPTMWRWPTKYGATNKQEIAAWDYIKSHPDWWWTLPAHADFHRTARECLWDLVQDHEVTFVTSRPGHGARQPTKVWLQFYLAESLDVQVLLTPKDKVQALVAMEPDVVIEDKVETLNRYCDARPEGWLPILVDRSYNMNARRDERIWGVKDTLTALELAGR